MSRAALVTKAEAKRLAEAAQVSASRYQRP